MFHVSGGAFKALFILAGFLALAALGCEYLESEEDVEAAILKPPSIRSIIDEADELNLGPVDLLERRRNAAIEDLEELYEERIDKVSSDAAERRLERRFERQTERLNANYDRRRARLEERLAADADG